MMFRENLVVAIKVNGRVLREVDGEVALPFGSEYSILIKNLNSVRAQVTISVDGTVASGYGRMIIDPNSDFELERFIREGNLTSGNRFRFIERTQDIEDHRGIKADDGIVRVEGWRERIIPEPPYVPPLYPVSPRPESPRRWTYGPIRPGQPMAGRSIPRRPGMSASLGPRPQHPMSRGRSEGTRANTPTVDSAPGITVAGSESAQRFSYVGGFPLESQSTVLTLRLKGEIGESLVLDAVTVDRQNACSTCGKNNKHRNKFCFSCGTALQLI